jgi:hypothetical protein
MSNHRTRKRFWLVMDEDGKFSTNQGDKPTRFYYKPEAKKCAEGMAAYDSDLDVFVLEATDFVRLAPPEPPVLQPKWKETSQD